MDDRHHGPKCTPKQDETTALLTMYCNVSCGELDVILKHSPYALEVNKYLKDKEHECKPYFARSPQLMYRDKIIENIRSICIKLKLSVITMHLAIHLLDIFMDNYNILVDRLNFVALACISLSAKFEQQDGWFPKISQLLSLDKNKYSNKDFVRLELMILQFFGWNLAQPTTAHFTEYYKWLSVLRSDCSNHESMRSLRKNAFLKVAEFLDISLEDYRVKKFQPSLIAACCILLCRQVLKLLPNWPIILKYVTGYDEIDLDFCSNFLMSLHNKCQCDKGTDNESNSTNEETDNKNISSDILNNSHDQEDTTDFGYHSRSSSNPDSPEETS